MGRKSDSVASFEASPNIALVKYWGMRDVALGLPYNSSLSLTLNRFRTQTTVRWEPELLEDELSINGEAAHGSALASITTFLDRIRSRTHDSSRAIVRSRNNFPISSGLASSASGFAALAGAATLAAGLKLSVRELSALARLGSGSASRSIFGGFVEWRRGVRPDGRDCYAHPVEGVRSWSTLVDLVAIVRDAPVKSARSAEAMQRTVATSPYYAERLREVPARIASMRRAIHRRDSETLFPLIMEECDSFRRACETTAPSLDYLTATSRAILGAVHTLNATSGRPVAAYTHDAGAHVHVFALQNDVKLVRRSLRAVRGIDRVWALRAGPGAHPIAARVR